jgi:hypothetical protein
MRLLDSIDRDGRLTTPNGRMIFGVPGFLYRSLLVSVGRWCAALLRFNSSSAFEAENRVRYLFSYIRERYATRWQTRRQQRMAQLSSGELR